MNILLISDTHQNIEFVQIMVDTEKNADLVIHLGDDYQDAQLFIDAGIPLIRVPGTWTPEYSNPMIDNRRFETFFGWKLFLTHTPTAAPQDLPDDIDPEQVIRDKQCDIFCHGHTHHPMISKAKCVTILNPGHLTSPIDRGARASFARLDVSNEACTINIIDFFTRTIVQEMVLDRP